MFSIGARNLHFVARRRPMRYALANMDWKNKLYFGDNLKIPRLGIRGGAVIPAKAGIHLGKLIYLDPLSNSSATVCRFVAPTFRSAFGPLGLPFGTGRAGLKPGATAGAEESAAQITAFGGA